MGETYVKQVILIHKGTQKSIRYRAEVYSLGFYLYTEEKSRKDKDYKLVDVTTRNTPNKVKNFIDSRVNQLRQEDYRIAAIDTGKVIKNKKTKQYVV